MHRLLLGYGLWHYNLEFLSSLAPLPPQTVATEAYEPNVPIARRRLAPLGVRVFDTMESSHEALPFTDGTFDLVVSRHESYAPSEVGRSLIPRFRTAGRRRATGSRARKTWQEPWNCSA